MTQADVFSGGGAVGALMRAHDWATTPLGPVAQWPNTLRAAVKLCLAAHVPILIGWGSDLSLLYNDACVSFLGTAPHPQTLGQPGRSAWPALWSRIGPLFERVLATGSATRLDDQALALERAGTQAERVCTFSCSPLRDDHGELCGVFCTIVETTPHGLSARGSVAPGSATQSAALAKGGSLEPPPRSVAPRQTSILVATVDAALRADVEQLLGARYEILVAGDGAAALAAARAQQFDLVFSDLTMPQLDGIELLRTLRADARTREIPFILLVTQAEEEAHAASLALGANDYLVKPFDAQALLARVETHLTLAGLRRNVEQQVRESEERLQMAKEAAALGIHDFDVLSGTIRWDARVHEIWGVGLDEPITYEVFFTGVHPEDRALVQTLVNRALDPAGDGQYDAEYRVINRADGVTRWVIATGRVMYEERRAVRLVGTVQDITVRKQAEERLQRLQEITARFSEAPSLDAVQRIMLSEVVRALGADGGGLRHIRAAGLVLDEFTLGVHMRDEAAHRFMVVPLDQQHPAAEVVRTGAALFIRDAEEFIQRYPDLADLAKQHYTQANAHLPLTRGGEVFGVLSLNFPEPHAWDEAERAFALALIDRATVAYERARLFDAERRARNRTERLQSLTARLATAITPADVVTAVIEEGLPTLGADAGSVVQLDGDELVIVGTVGFAEELTQSWRRFPLSERTPLADAIHTRQSIWLETHEAFQHSYGRLPSPQVLVLFQSLVALPLISHGQILGALGLAYTQTQVFDPDSRRFAETLADLCAQALERSWLYIERARLLEQERTARRAFEAIAAQFRTFLDASPAGVAFLDADLRYRHINLRLAELNGLAPEAHLGRTMHELWPNADGEIGALLRRVLESGAPVLEQEFTGQREYAGRIWLTSYYPVRDASEAVIGVGILVHEITERKVAEEALREAQARRLAEEQQYAERLRQLNAASLQINAATRRDEVLHLISATARSLIGAHQAITSATGDAQGGQAINAVALSEKYAGWMDWRPQPDASELYAMFTPSNTPLRLTQTELEAHPAWQSISAADSRPPMRGCLAVPLLGRDGSSIGLIQLSDKYEGEFTAADEALLQQLAQIASVALEKQTLYEQEQTARAQAEEANRLKDEFLATVSHELRTPLTAFLGYSQILQRRKDDHVYLDRTIEKMVRSAKAQAQIIEDLLDVSLIVSGKLRIEPQPIDLIPVIRAALDTVRPAVEAKGLRLHIDLRPEASSVIGDANRLQQVLWNLLANATKFTPSGGTIQVCLETQGHDAQITVGDTGQGISPAFLPYVFDRFRQADSTSHRVHGGLGLGLSIVRHLVELHGGSVQAASAGLGQGTTFTVRLPLARADDVAEARTAAHDEGHALADCPAELRGLRVLVVDDQPDILELIHDMLVSCGSVVQMCNNARQALDVVRTWRPDMLVSDIAMPNDDGYWLIRQVRALAPEDGGSIPAVALTAYVRVEDRMRVLAAGFQLYVPKPVDLAELVAVLASLAQAPPNA